MFKTLISLLLLAVCAIFAASRGCKIRPALYSKSITTIHDMMKFTEAWEGRRAKQYKDSRGNLTIGVGHLIRRGENFYGMELTQRQIDLIFRADMVAAYVEAKKSVKDFDSLPHEVKLVVCDMAYNLGGAGFRKFKRAISACNTHDFPQMAEEMKNSRWYSQTGERAKHHVALLEKIGA